MTLDLSSGELRVGGEFRSPTERVAILERDGRVMRCVFDQSVFNTVCDRLWGEIRDCKIARGHVDLGRADDRVRDAVSEAIDPM